jgi:hypothetical protein
MYGVLQILGGRTSRFDSGIQQGGTKKWHKER